MPFQTLRATFSPGVRAARRLMGVATQTSAVGRYIVELDHGYTRFMYLRGCAARVPIFFITIVPMDRWMGFHDSSPASGYISTFGLHFASGLARQSVEAKVVDEFLWKMLWECQVRFCKHYYANISASKVTLHFIKRFIGSTLCHFL